MVNGTDANTPTSRELGKYHEEESKLLTTLPMQLTDMPVFLNHMIPKVGRNARIYCRYMI